MKTADEWAREVADLGAARQRCARSVRQAEMNVQHAEANALQEWEYYRETDAALKAAQVEYSGALAREATERGGTDPDAPHDAEEAS